MKKLISIVMTLALGVVLSACSGSGEEDPATPAAGEAPAAASISIANFSFSDPDPISVGQTVTVTNSDSVSHTWTSEEGVFDSEAIGPGESFEFTFDEAGEYEFVCSFHPQMTGSITVEG